MTKNDHAEDDEAVGYKRPPKRTRFKPGKSGNPRGRPKGTRNLKTDLFAELEEKMFVREDGVRKRVSKQRAAIKALMAKAVGGDHKALTLLVAMIDRLSDRDESVREDGLSLSEKDHVIVQGLLAFGKKGGGQ